MLRFSIHSIICPTLIIGHGAAISASVKQPMCEQGRRRLRLELDVISYGAALRACDKGQLREHPLGFLRVVLSLHLELYEIRYGIAIGACEKMQLGEQPPSPTRRSRRASTPRATSSARRPSRGPRAVLDGPRRRELRDVLDDRRRELRTFLDGDRRRELRNALRGQRRELRTTIDEHQRRELRAILDGHRRLCGVGAFRHLLRYKHDMLWATRDASYEPLPTDTGHASYE